MTPEEEAEVFGLPISEAEYLLLTLGLLFLAGIVMYFFARMLLVNLQQSANQEQPITTLMSILGIISVVALIGALFTGAESAYTIAATGVGAFAGALTARTVTHGREEQEPEGEEPQPQGDDGA